ncbi:MAG TPA: molybdopterin molybdotransferase MoeA [Methanocella sp.]|nr:molybdopterin molybdotransferase MoeA [Methanocella sp.]
MMTANGEHMVALNRALELIDGMRSRFYGILSTEEVAVDCSSGRLLAADAISKATSPPYDVCTMDGYAIRSADHYPVVVVGKNYAGSERAVINRGETVYVTTGAQLPKGADAVMRVEDARLDNELLSGPELKPWTNVLRMGADFAAGDVLLAAGTLVTPAMIGALQAAYTNSVRVFRQISVAVLSTGDEIIKGHIRDTNSPVVCAMLRSWGCQAVHMGIIPDDPDATRSAIGSAAADFDMVITIGGVSAGTKDYVKLVTDEGEVVFRSVKVKPGTPFTASYYRGRPVFSLPGKPAGCFVGMEIFVRRFIHGMTMNMAISLPVCCNMDFNIKGFDYLVFAELKAGQAYPMGYRGSSLGLLPGPDYVVSQISASARSLLAQGYFLARDDLKAGQIVHVVLI